MKELLVSIHNMMEQIVANTGSGQPAGGNYVRPTTSVTGNSAPDSYGNPLASPVSGTSQPSTGGSLASYSPGTPRTPAQGSSAPDSYGNPLASPIGVSPPGSSGQSNSDVGSSSDSYGVAQAAVIDTQASYSSSGEDPVIRSTLEQIRSALRKYRDTETGIDERSQQDGE